MNARKAKHLRRKSYEMAAVWIQTMLPEDQREGVTVDSVKAFEKEQERHVYANGKVVVSAYSSRWFYERLKKAETTGAKLDLTLQSAAGLGE